MKKYNIVIKDKIEYVLKVKKTKSGNTKYTLYRSKNSEWTNPGEKLMSIVDNGNGLKLQNMDVFCFGKIEYDVAAELVILFDSVMQLGDVCDKYEIVQ